MQSLRELDPLVGNPVNLGRPVGIEIETPPHTAEHLIDSVDFCLVQLRDRLGEPDTWFSVAGVHQRVESGEGVVDEDSAVDAG